MDNVFVFAVIFRFFQVPPQYQYRVLFWGILGAIVLRLAFVLAGTQLVHRFDWVLPLFGLLLIYTAVRLALRPDGEVDPGEEPGARFARRLLPVAEGDHRHGHAVLRPRRTAGCAITPLFLVLLVIESTDVLFAVDSVPAIFGITPDPFIVFTSNIFADPGPAGIVLPAGRRDADLRYLHYGLAAVLGFVGAKMIAEYFLTSPGTPPDAHGAKLLVIAAAAWAFDRSVDGMARGRGLEVRDLRSEM